MIGNQGPDCVLWGGYEGRNAGDELILAVALRDAHRCFGDSVAILSTTPALTQWHFPDEAVIPYVPRKPPSWHAWCRKLSGVLKRRGLARGHYVPEYRLGDQLGSGRRTAQWVEVVLNSRELYLVGGGYLCDLFGLARHLLPIAVAASASVPVRTAPIGLGPFAGRSSAQMAANCLRDARVVVRDEVSLSFCKQHGIAAELRPDDGFRICEVIPGLRRDPVGVAGRGRNEPPRIGFCVLEQSNLGGAVYDRKWWIRLLRKLLEYQGRIDVQGFCVNVGVSREFNTMADLFAAAGCGVKRVLPPAPDFRETFSRIASYDVVVSCRYHPVVAADALGIPSVAIASGKYYKAKMSSAKRFGHLVSRVVDPAVDEPEQIADHVVKIASRADS